MSVARTLTLLAAALAAAFAAVPASARPNPHAALDCAYCHLDTPVFGVDTRATVNFWRAEGDEPALCERCHSDDQNLHPLGIPGPQCLDTVCPVSLPLGASEAVKGQVVCTTCHFLHAADADRSLLRGFPGSDRPKLFKTWQELCRQCHGANLEKRSPHAGDDRACAFCHSAKPVAGQPVTVTPAGRRLCAFCHGNIGTEEHYAGVNPFKEPQECTGCHDPHLGKEHPARLKKDYFEPIKDLVTLNPHGKRTLCFACHADGYVGKRLREGDAVALCQRCHGSGRIPGMSHPMTAVPAGYAIPEGWPLAGGKMTCLTCHRPGHPDEDRSAAHLLRGAVPRDRTAVCFACHKRDQWAGMNPHREVAEKRSGCETCHVGKPVWGQNEPQVVAFRTDVNILCLACHNPTTHPGGVAHTMTITEAMPKPSPDLPLGKGNRITCATCHNPHMDRKDGHNLRGPKSPVPFCSRCHRDGEY